MKKIMIIEDDTIISKELYELLVNAGYEALILKDFSNAKEEILKSNIDLILLDINIPSQNGEQLLKEIRKESNIPVIMVTSRASETDEILSISYGADDYITKPFNPEELIARVNAIIRRCSKNNVLSEKAGLIKAGNLTIDDELKKVVVDGKEVKLTPTEYNILKFLTQNKGKVYSIDEIYTNIWEEESFAAENIIAVHIRHIREKIEVNPKEPKYLKVIWGVGYKVENL